MGDTGIVDQKVISSAPKHYHLILCLDPKLYTRALQRASLPVMMCASAQELNEHPEILEVTDYLLPSPSSLHDAALRQLIADEVLHEADRNPKADESVVGDTDVGRGRRNRSRAKLTE